ncbi:hypothetical protein J19TS2_33120 [Cohnella xylanilytica]|uniref:DUF1697 domain-containing protein n=1 Tax=Cohnella xylanilytica TaxID=557555 RepID=A0A841TZ12_9BACL|nr:DUF1697 domain-containing protein [Cohnella xylanilytica]MBB6690894.1 DUF1697 domain-containing protein [Cohnella xylanilytica]GIO13757.1 hypothetical protein J19TS2_33120 [Cohnella xylanilytica]
MATYVALLRGINVGGKNKIKMADLKREFENLGYGSVRTYIQSGNVLFESDEGEAALRESIEGKIDSAFGIPAKVILRTSDELSRLAAGCPFSPEEIAEAEALGQGESLYVSMMADEPSAEGVAKLAAAYPADGEDKYVIRGRDVYLLFRGSVRDSKLAMHLGKLDVPATTRNWKTLGKLVELAGVGKA